MLPLMMISARNEMPRDGNPASVWQPNEVLSWDEVWGGRVERAQLRSVRRFPGERRAARLHGGSETKSRMN
ncbi:MAG: hypothetical protein J0H67_23605 [Rhodospirillales bacterium]|nr:hypothetical protein [Rhodospirillales bacterium]MBN8900281.1 hypothetical protein [Rhodospirillales bacterium]